MPKQTEIVAIVAGTLMIAGGVALQLAGKPAPAELWVAGTAALSGGLGLAIPSSSSSSSALEGLAGELSKLAGYLTAKATPVAAQPEPAPAAAAPIVDGPAAVAPPDSPSATGAPAPATSTTTTTTTTPLASVAAVRTS
jgi:hypothetical protein